MLDAIKVAAEVAAWLCIGVVVCGGMLLVARLTVIGILDACRPVDAVADRGLIVAGQRK